MNKAEKIKAEIEKRKQELHPTNTHKMQVGEKIDRDVLMWLNALTWVKNLIDTLDEEPVSNDLEEAARKAATWKPSDEQIVVLDLACKYERVFTPKQIDILIDLKEQLKKLK